MRFDISKGVVGSLVRLALCPMELAACPTYAFAYRTGFPTRHGGNVLFGEVSCLVLMNPRTERTGLVMGKIK